MALLQEGSQGVCNIAHNPSCLVEFKNERAEKINQVQSYITWELSWSLPSPGPHQSLPNGIFDI